MGLSAYDAAQLTSSKATSDFFEKAVDLGGDAKLVSNWLQGDIAQYLNAEGQSIDAIGLTPDNLVEMLALVKAGTISSKIAKKVFVHLAKNGGSAEVYVKSAGLVQISDPAQLLPLIQEVFVNNEKAIADYKGGNKNAAKSLIGQLMKATKGQANPQVAQKLLNEELEKLTD